MSQRASDPTLEALRIKLRDEMNEVTNSMARGGCVTFEAYQNDIGKIEGLAFAERELLDLDERMGSH
jgi:hypothetical protein